MQANNTSQFTVTCRSSATLNYLIFLQNMYINNYRGQILKNVRRLKFPYLNTASWGILDPETFCQRFKETWSKIVDFLSTYDGIDVDEAILLNRRNEWFGGLFTDNAEGNKALEESYLSFLSWWENDGHSQIDNSIKTVEQFIQYEILATTSQNPPEGNLILEFTFDDFPLVEGEDVRKFFVISRPMEIRFLLHTNKMTKSLSDKINLSLF